MACRELTLGLQRWEDKSKSLEPVSTVARTNTLRDNAPKESRGHHQGLAPLAKQITARTVPKDQESEIQT